jgi:uncharacterized protein
VSLDAAGRGRARALAEELIAAAGAHVGRSRDELTAALSAIDVGPRDHRLRSALAKLIEDRCVFDANEDLDAESVRRDVFTRASATRAALGATDRFDRAAVLAYVAAERGATGDAVERALFADLRGTHVLTTFAATSAAALVSSYERAQAQAVLLRAVKVTVDVRCASAAGLRGLFRRLKFLRLLHSIERRGDGHRIVIDGPFSLFESVTKYGLQLALVLPALEPCDAWHLEADLRWGKERAPLLFRLSGGASPGALEPPPLADEVQALVRTFRALDTPWKVRANAVILELPGIGLTVPDLVFERRVDGEAGARASERTSEHDAGRDTRQRVYLEVMGYWSRAAVWKRVELVQAGLGERILFAVSSRLRVSEDVLDGDLPGALYVYKQAMSARAVADRLDRLAAAPLSPRA